MTRSLSCAGVYRTKRICPPPLVEGSKAAVGFSQNVIQSSKMSAKTLRKHTRALIDNRFIHIIRQKPMIFEFLVNDVTLWYLTMKGLPVPDMDSICKDSISKIDASRDITGSREIMDKLIKLHIYSSTVTEGNTASNEDVERIINDLPTNLTPYSFVHTAKEWIPYLCF